MEFIILTNPEYRRILRRRIWHTPGSTARAFGEMPGAGARRKSGKRTGFILLFIFGPTVLLLVRGTDWVRFLFDVGMMLLPPLLFFTMMILVRTSEDRSAHKEFIKKVKSLDLRQYEQLLSEYPFARKIDFYDDHSKGILGVERIFVTDNFLFIPGLFLIRREEVETMVIRVPERDSGKEFAFLLVSPFGKVPGGDEFSRMYRKLLNETYRYRIHPETGKRTYLLKDEAEEVFRLDYSYDRSPETAEQIMAWFWKCDPNDPTFLMRMEAWIEKCRETKAIG